MGRLPHPSTDHDAIGARSMASETIDRRSRWYRPEAPEHDDRQVQFCPPRRQRADIAGVSDLQDVDPEFHGHTTTVRFDLNGFRPALHFEGDGFSHNR